MTQSGKAATRTGPLCGGFALGRCCPVLVAALPLWEIRGQKLRCHGLRRRKNCGLFVAGMVTDLLVPSSVTLVIFVTQPVVATSVPACSNAKPTVSTDGQETITSGPERRTESAGRVSRYARAMYPDTFPPAVV